MEIFRRKDNYKNPVKTAKRNFFAIGLLYLVLGALMYNSDFDIRVSISLLVGALIVLAAAVLLNKRKMSGVYMGWLFVITGLISTLISKEWISLAIVAYIGYWNYKAQESLKSV